MAITLRKYSMVINPFVAFSTWWCFTRPRIASILLKENALSVYVS